MNLARAVRTLHRPQWVPRPLENLTLITPPWRGGREPAMSLDVRAAAVATGACGLRGWAAKAQCGLSHTPADAFAGFRTGCTIAGGMEARRRVYERMVPSNPMPHPDGIGGVDDDTLLRAMSSGVGRDGRPLHWQALPWDLTSNWSEEDRRAMPPYPRALSPVPGRVPGPRPPRVHDPVADAFGFGKRAIR